MTFDTDVVSYRSKSEKKEKADGVWQITVEFKHIFYFAVALALPLHSVVKHSVL